MTRFVFWKDRVIHYPWRRAKKSLGAMSLCFILSIPGWTALRNMDLNISTQRLQGKAQEETAVFFQDVLADYKEPAQRFSRMSFGDVSLEECLAELGVLAEKEGARILSMKPVSDDKKHPKDGVRRRMIDMVLQAPEDRVPGFLKGLSDLTFFSSCRTLVLSVPKTEDSPVDVRLTLEIFDEVRLPREKTLAHLKKMLSLNEKTPRFQPDMIAGKQKMFRPIVVKPQRAVCPQETKEDILKYLTLVGIMEDGGWRAAFEDARTQRTFYVSDLVVSDINSSQVTLTGGDQCYTLSL
jgi:hypothetical protein